MQITKWTAGQLALVWLGVLVFDGFVAGLYFNHDIDSVIVPYLIVVAVVQIALFVVTWKWFGHRGI